MASINGKKDPTVGAKKKTPAKKKAAKKKAAKKKAPKKKAPQAAGYENVDPEPGKSMQGGKGTTFKEEPGKPEEHTEEWLPSSTLPEGTLTANVNVSMGARVGLPDYSDARCGASITIPVAAEPEEIASAYEFCKRWVEVNVQDMIDEIKGENE